MKSEMLQSIESLFADEPMQQMAQQTGETLPALRKALQQVIPAILKGFAAKASEGSEATVTLLAMAKDANNNSWWAHARHWFEDTDKAAIGSGILKDLFGHHNVDRLAQHIGQQNNIKAASAATLLQWAAPLCLGMLGKHAVEQNLNAGTLASSLAGLNSELSSNITNQSTVATAPPDKREATSAGNPPADNRLLWTVLLMAALLALAFFFAKGCKNKTPDVLISEADTTTSGSVQQARIPTFTLNADSTLQYVYGDTITEKLPDGTELRIPDNSAEAVLINHIQNALAKGLDTTEDGLKRSWINLYNVQFSKMLSYRNGAESQIKNIAIILKAFPMVKIKIGGYTDATGSAKANEKISRERALKVAGDLRKAGVKTQISGAEGYGPAFPVADNGTAEGRAQNRRVSCRITSVVR